MGAVEGRGILIQLFFLPRSKRVTESFQPEADFRVEVSGLQTMIPLPHCNLNRRYPSTPARSPAPGTGMLQPLSRQRSQRFSVTTDRPLRVQ